MNELDENEWLRIWEEPDLDAVRAISADDLEVTAVTAAIEPRHYTGREAAVQWLVELEQRLGGDWSVQRMTRLADDAVVFEGELRFQHPVTTGADVQTFAILMRLRDGKVRWIGTFMNLDAARDAFKLGVAG